MSRIKVYYMEHCPYCTELMDGLDGLGFEYEKIDVDSKDGEKKFLKLYKVTHSENIPIIIIDNQVLVPEISFNTINEAISLIEKLYLNTT